MVWEMFAVTKDNPQVKVKNNKCLYLGTYFMISSKNLNILFNISGQT